MINEMHNYTQHNGRLVLCWVSFMLSLVLSVTYKPFMLSVVMLNVIIPCAVAPLIAITYEFNPSLTFTSKARSLVEWSLVSTPYVMKKLL